jgi:hypothetical protein
MITRGVDLVVECEELGGLDAALLQLHDAARRSHQHHLSTDTSTSTLRARRMLMRSRRKKLLLLLRLLLLLLLMLLLMLTMLLLLLLMMMMMMRPLMPYLAVGLIEVDDAVTPVQPLGQHELRHLRVAQARDQSPRVCTTTRQESYEARQESTET